MDILNRITEEFKLKPENIKNIVALIDDGNTIPFIARYRKELTGHVDDQVLRELNDRLLYLRNLEKRKDEVRNAIIELNKMTEEIEKALSASETLTEVEDVYRPFKQKKKTRASVAIEKGLKPLADIILLQENGVDIEDIAKDYINEEKGVNTIIDAINGAKDIIAEIVSDDANVRKKLRKVILKNGIISTKIIDIAKDSAKAEKAATKKAEAKAEKAATKKAEAKSAMAVTVETKSVNAEIAENVKSFNNEPKQSKEKIKQDLEKSKTYEMYADYSEPVAEIKSHRILAINRGESEGFLKVKLEFMEDLGIRICGASYIKAENNLSNLIKEAIEDSYSRLIFPSIEREIRSYLTEIAGEQAIKMFEVNLKPLLMQAPVKDKITMGLDPAYRTGCKICVVDGTGKVLDKTVVYPTPPQNKIEEAKTTLKKLIEKYAVEIISIGNGTASKESEIFVVNLIAEVKNETGRNVNYIVVSEAGASVYSASPLGAEEFPDYDVSERSAVSIARRLQDPLAELIKIDPKSIGVGQYQHDMDKKRLDGVLEGVLEDCVNSVGVDLNTASYSLLKFVAGLNLGIAKNIVVYREKNGKFKNRQEILKVAKLGEKAFTQCAGFLRIVDGDNILDNTAVHPESYENALKLLKRYNYTKNDIEDNKLSQLPKLISDEGVEKVAKECALGVSTLNDIVSELVKPGRDIREDFSAPLLRSDIMGIEDLISGMELIGTVRNVIDFGVFVDIGVHQDGLVHISQITDKYIKHPSEVLKVGQIVKVMVLEVNVDKKRIALTMKGLQKKVN